LQRNISEVEQLREQQEKVIKPLQRVQEDVANITEKHLLNFFDEVGDLPEYEPYSLQVSKINPVPFLIAKNDKERSRSGGSTHHLSGDIGEETSESSDANQ